MRNGEHDLIYIIYYVEGQKRKVSTKTKRINIILYYIRLPNGKNLTPHSKNRIFPPA